MARKRRSCPPGVIFHLCNRSAAKLTLFQNSYDYLQVLEVFHEALGKFPISIYAYCMMPNHWHLLAQAQKPKTISRFMHWFGTTHASRYRNSHASVGQGAVYQNRFRSHPVEGSAAFLTTAAYIERNPLAAGLVPTAISWPWSSAGEPTSLPVASWPYPKPENWPLILATPPEATLLEQIRYSEISAKNFRIPSPQRLAIHLAA